MQRILKQNEELRGSKEAAESKVKYTWHKNEIVWRYCNTVHSISRIRLTGERWLIGSVYGYSKIYQFEILSSSSTIEVQGVISHDNECAFFETLESACEYAIKHINYLLEFQTKTLKEDRSQIRSYKLKQNTFKKEVITEKTEK